jgi:hypothetical protein
MVDGKPILLVCPPRERERMMLLIDVLFSKPQQF